MWGEKMRHAEISSENDEVNQIETVKNKVIILLLLAIILIWLFFAYWPESKLSSLHLVYTLVFILLFIAGFFYAKVLFDKQYKIERLFVIIIIPLGIIYTLIIPPGIVADEWTHMYFVNSLASQITGNEQNEKVTMRTIDVELYNTQNTNPNNDYYDYIYNNLFKIDNNDTYSNIDIKSVPLINIFGYFPSVIGVIIARILNFGAITTVYFGRLFNFIFYLFLTFQAIKKIPFGKILLFAIALLPMACHQMFTLSYDAVINASSFLCIAYGLFFVYQSNRVNLKDIIIYSLSGILLLANKGSAYAFILTIPILAKYFNPNGNKVAKKTKIIIFLIVIISILILNYQSFTNTSQVTATQSISGEGIVPWTGTPSYTLTTLLTNIPGTVSLFINTFIQKGWWYISTAIGSHLGWLNILMPNWLINCWLGILLTSALTEKSNNEVFTYEHKLLYFLISLAVIFVVMLAMALTWTPDGYSVIEGVQGRYFIPIIFLSMVCLQNSKIYLKENINRILLIIILIMSLISIYSLMALVF